MENPNPVQLRAVKEPMASDGVAMREAVSLLNVRFWHKADMSRLSSNVCFWG